MKKAFLLVVLFVAGMAFGQEGSKSNGATDKGSIVIEANTGSAATGNTSFSLSSQDGFTEWRIGVDGGYFVADNFAIKAGLGYGDSDLSDGNFVYKVGAQYYINGMIPVGVDFTGYTAGEGNQFIGLEGGYAWFVADNVAVTPKLRYNLSLDDNIDDHAFQGLIGFSIFF